MALSETPTRQPVPSGESRADPGRELVLAVIGSHAGPLLAVARRHSLCPDDAYDAYQRALEIFLRRAGSVDPATAPAWLRTVVKHEALAVRASRQRIVGPVEVDLDRSEAREQLPAEDLVAAGERAARSTEALARLKPQEVRALVLKARGYSYREICEITGWTYTKVNRCLTEGRRAFLDRVADIESGRECERWAGTLSALADGEASAGDLAAARPHLRHCPACRATLREFRRAPHAVAALAPAGTLLAAAGCGDASGPLAGPAGDGGVHGLLSRLHDAVLGGWHERVVLSAHKAQAAVEAASAGKLAAVAASATALAGGGAAALSGAAAEPVGRPAAVASPARPRATAPPRVPDPAGSVPAASSRAARLARRGTGSRRAKPLPAAAATEFGPGGGADAPAKPGASSAPSGASASPSGASASPSGASASPSGASASPSGAAAPATAPAPASTSPARSRRPAAASPSSSSPSPSSSEFAP